MSCFRTLLLVKMLILNSLWCDSHLRLGKVSGAILMLGVQGPLRACAEPTLKQEMDNLLFLQEKWSHTVLDVMTRIVILQIDNSLGIGNGFLHVMLIFCHKANNYLAFCTTITTSI